ncbi:tol-pal system protein YbgF [Shimia biformata]|uniref:tol-pal system protein YbgF n=1 Tax=Shimia biformata TaxID=1294299 RepID=UPI00194FF9CC|nr:tol-pal system protein YbgF [Shimia biformata]
MRLIPVLVLSLAVTLALPVSAQSTKQETLADIRQQLTLLYGDVQRLKRELSTTGGVFGQSTGGGSALERMDLIERELQRLTNKTEELEFRIQRVVEDGTNRVGDLEFRLVELEGGDVSTLGETTTLGGDVETGSPSTGGSNAGSGTVAQPTELAVGERADFDRATAALEGSDFQSASDQFAAFTTTYPGSPLESEAHLRRGQALEGLEQLTGAARAYLESYSRNPTGATAPEALYRLGATLGRLNQQNEACVTLGEVGYRYPDSSYAGDADTEMLRLGCS